MFIPKFTDGGSTCLGNIPKNTNFFFSASLKLCEVARIQSPF